MLPLRQVAFELPKALARAALFPAVCLKGCIARLNLGSATLAAQPAHALPVLQASPAHQVAPCWAPAHCSPAAQKVHAWPPAAARPGPPAQPPGRTLCVCLQARGAGVVADDEAGAGGGGRSPTAVILEPARDLCAAG